jgi:hypothetical protein
MPMLANMVAAVEAGSSSKNITIRIGDHVCVKWNDGVNYGARVTEMISDDKATDVGYHVQFDADQSKSIDPLTKAEHGTVRIFGRNLRSKMPLDPTHVCLKQTCV